MVIGPSHYVRFRGLAIPTVEAFATPLGHVPIDKDAMAVLEGLGSVIRADTPHLPEHALEVELPFLQMVLQEGFELVPILVGEAGAQDVAGALGQLWGGPETIIVVSSDLSHFHTYEAAQRLDAVTAARIERGDWASLGPDGACGYLAVAGLLIEAGRRGLTVNRLSLCNSGDTAGPRDRVVGYGAWVFTDAHSGTCSVSASSVRTLFNTAGGFACGRSQQHRLRHESLQSAHAAEGTSSISPVEGSR